MGHKRVQRLHSEESLNLRAKRPWRHVAAARRVERAGAAHANNIWSIDFVADASFNGGRFRALTVVDAFTRECLAIVVDQGLIADAVVATVERLAYGAISIHASCQRTAGWRCAMQDTIRGIHKVKPKIAGPNPLATGGQRRKVFYESLHGEGAGLYPDLQRTVQIADDPSGALPFRTE